MWEMTSSEKEEFFGYTHSKNNYNTLVKFTYCLNHFKIVYADHLLYAHFCLNK